jgi:hypothetical protein
MGSIVAALQLLLELIKAVKWFTAWYSDNKDQAWFKESTRVFRQLQAAKSDEEKKRAVSDLAKLIGSM